MSNKQNYIEFREFVKKVLESQYEISFEKYVKSNFAKSKVNFDLANIDEGYFVEIDNNLNSIKLNTLVARIKENYRAIDFVTNVRYSNDNRLILVSKEEFSQEKREKLKKLLLKTEVRKDPIILDILDLEKLAMFSGVDFKPSFSKDDHNDSIKTVFLDDEVKSNTEYIDNRQINEEASGPPNPIFYGEQDSKELKQTDKNIKDFDFLQVNPNIDEGYELHRFVRDVLNAEFTLNLSIEKSRVIEDSKIDFDLVDYNTDSYAVLLKRDYFSNFSKGKEFDSKFESTQIVIDAHSKITFHIHLILSKGLISKYFVFLDESFSENEVKQIKDLLKDAHSRIVEILRFSDLHLLANKNNVDTKDYLFESVKISEIENSETIKTKDKIPFHLDNVETIDKLNREPVAKSLARLINKDIFDQEEMNHSFMVHLQGEWGSGKSTFLNLIEKHLQTDSRKWVVVKYNAWQNQHISPPWWTFLNQLFKQGINQVDRISRPRFILGEKLRRVIWYSGWNKILTLVVSIILLLIVVLNFSTIFTSVTSIAKLDDNFTSADFAKLILSIGSVVALVFSFSKFLATPFTLKSSKQAEAFTTRASDPMTQIKNHFNHLIASYNKADREVAVFIDDIDRCNREYTIELLEGIQTLFKDRRVLYIVAGDTKWITSCFENNYKEFSKVAADQGQNLGELFLEKAFQLSVRMPNVSEESKQAYWKEIIGDTLDIQVELEDDGGEMTNEEREEIKREIVEFYNQNENSNIERNLIQEKYNISNEQVTDLAIEGLDENTEDVRHLLMSFHNLISPNPRSIKRLANNYSMYRNTLIAEQTNFKPGHLFRWLLLEDKYPMLIKHFLKENTLDNFADYIEHNGGFTELEVTDLNNIIYGRDDKEEGELHIEELHQILRK